MKTQLKKDNLIIFESALFRTTTTVIIEDNFLLLVDPNWLPEEVAFIRAYLQPFLADRQAYLLFTHSDYDHIIGYGSFKGFETIASQNFVDSRKKVINLKAIQKFDDQYYIQRNYPIEYPIIDIAISKDSALIFLGNNQFQIFQARGHNDDGIITYHQDRGILIVGDYLSNIEFPYIYDSVSEYKSTLDILEKIISENNIKILISGHGDYTTDQSEMKHRIKESRQYIEDLENSVKNNTPFDLEKLFQRYDFPTIMTQFHNGNLEIMKKEMEESLRSQLGPNEMPN